MSLCDTDHTGSRPPERPFPTDRSNTNRAHINTLDTPSSILHSTYVFSAGPVLLKTAISDVMSTSGTCISTNILFDEGAQSLFITEKCARELNLQPAGTQTVSLSGFEDVERRVRHLQTATILLKPPTFDIPLNVLIVPQISVPIATYQQQAQTLPYLRGLKFAHPVTAADNFEIELLIGANHYWDIVENHIVRGNGPTAVRSKIGFLLSGPLYPNNAHSNLSTSVSMMNIITGHTQEEIDIEKFWRIESYGVEREDEKDEPTHYLKTYQDTCITYHEGRYYAKLPWKETHDHLPTNEVISRRRTQSVIQRLRKEPTLLQKYGEIISEQESRGFIEKVDVNSSQVPRRVHYIPHHPVKKDSKTTPIRIVYDCSCKSAREHPSLNECLMNTPPHLNDLTSILLQFRHNRYAVSADIEKAFLNIELHPDDRDVTRFFWLSDPDDPYSPLQTYRFKSVLFGATCSPFILDATILKPLDIHPCPEADVIHKGLYVDNVLSSFHDNESLKNFYTGSKQLFQRASFNLRAWSSNSQSLRSIASSDNVVDSDLTPKVLGMRWNPTSDQLSFPWQPNNQIDSTSLTKRQVLKETSSVFDPMGFLSPITIKAKIVMQSLWQPNTDWDTILPENVANEWCTLRQELHNATQTMLRRSFFTNQYTSQSDLHIFTDASMKAYGACAYLVSGNESTLIMAKTKVSPLKQLTIPKLELSAAVLGSRLCKHVTNSITCSNVYMWSDSKIVISWIRSTKKLPVFIANRVNEIKTLTTNYNWNYCSTINNPADMLSRGLPYDKFANNRMWFHGPQWLTSDRFPTFAIDVDFATKEMDTEIQNTITLTTADDPLQTLDVFGIHRYSSFRKLQRVTAYVLQFIGKCRRKIQHVQTQQGSTQLNTAADVLIKQAQERHYKTILRYLGNENRTTETQKPSLVRQLNLCLDSSGLIRCKGRMSNAPLPMTTKLPYLLPPKDNLTDLIIADAHRVMLHSGTESTVTYLRQSFWIPTIRQRVRNVVRRCVTCRKVTGQAYRTPDPPPLPTDRLKEAPPFTVTGINFTGALTVKKPNGSVEKAYICLFTCANTQAVHFELVPDMTVHSFLLAFRRFISRKSMPKVVMSDNALTYIAASKILKDEILTDNGITWKFIPQHAPWYGGWWERLIGITKTCIKKVLGKGLISSDVLRTIVAEVECIINDRPLTHISSDVSDQEPLTPSQLIYGRRITSPVYPNTRIPDDDVTPTDITRDHATKIYRFKSATLDHFWTRWKQEYLTSLRECHNLSGKSGDLVKIGTVVQIHDDYQPRNQWLLGAIQDVLPGGDGSVRAAVVRTRRGVTTRPIAKLYPLELV